MKSVVRYLLPILLAAVAAFGSDATLAIRLDQAGYGPRASKVAAVVFDVGAKEFVVRKVKDGSVVFRGILSQPAADPDSGDRVQSADFSKLYATGSFFLEVPGVGKSWEFSIGPGAYSRALYLSMRSFYGQRCGIAVDLGPEFAGYKHDACHLEGAFHASSGRSGAMKSTGGWHDAGDYGRYVVNSGISTGTLLWAWELFEPKLKGLQLNIPESGNATPDFLDEIRWNLEWMLSMQDQDGGAWHKQTSERFCGFIPPDKDTLVSYVIGTGKEPHKSSCATADLAAVTAIAARVYRRHDAAFAYRCSRAAQSAWKWLEAHPDVLFQNPAGVSTGGYGDRNCGDERLWAAAELWRTTREDRYNQYFLEHYQEHRKTVRGAGPPSWANVAPLGLWTYALAPRRDKAAAEAIRQDSFAAANEIVKRTSAHPYRISMTGGDYIWGSNGVVANYGMQLFVANAMSHHPAYVAAALDNLHYLLGKNAFSVSFVTQVGANPYRHPHHRPSGSDQNPEPWPGLLSGGPNGRKQDPAMRRLPDLPPARMFVDVQESFASNEVAINWNAPLVFLLAGASSQ